MPFEEALHYWEAIFMGLIVFWSSFCGLALCTSLADVLAERRDEKKYQVMLNNHQSENRW